MRTSAGAVSNSWPLQSAHFAGFGLPTLGKNTGGGSFVKAALLDFFKGGCMSCSNTAGAKTQAQQEMQSLNLLPLAGTWAPQRSHSGSGMLGELHG
jgi:hypothetical protein